MISLTKLRVIARAKFSDKSNLGDWYNKRLEICGECPLNSLNKETLTAMEMAKVAANFGKPTCLACGCEVSPKASVREEICGLDHINMEPLWHALPSVEEGDYNNYKIQNLNSDKVKLTFGKTIHLDYGNIEQGDNTEIEISIKSKDNDITKLESFSSCSCTVSKPKKKGDTYYIKLSYDSSRLGNFNKTVSVAVTKKDIQEIVKINIKGLVNKKQRI